ncbi:MAG: energy transducer TonB [Acidimicrobiia bacterium]|nr:energy transducer TonB [Acidimicrobiia bacterium]
MKHDEKGSPTDASARLDALMEDFLSRDIGEIQETHTAGKATDEPLGDLFAPPSIVQRKPVDSAAPPAASTVAPIDRIEVREASNKQALPPKAEPPTPASLTTKQLERDVNSILAASASAARARRISFAASVAILSLTAGLLIWKSWSDGLSQEIETMSVSTVPPSEMDLLLALDPSTSRGGLRNGSEAPEAGVPKLKHGGGDEPWTALVPVSSAAEPTPKTAPTPALPSAASHAAQFERMPAPAIGNLKPALRTIQSLPTLESTLPPTLLPLPPDLPPSAPNNIKPESARSIPATLAVPIMKVQPVYPELALRTKLGGIVHVAFVVDTEGEVASARAIDGQAMLRTAAEQAVKQWRFRPATVNGKPVVGRGTASVTFSPSTR